MITDPYKVLNIAPNASAEEVKKAYRDLARKYHPDHYHGPDLEHMAEEKMKEINEAYAVIQQQRKGGGTQQGYSSGSSGGGYQSYGQSAASHPLFQRIRILINSGDIVSAEQLLEQTDLRTAEWHFLMGSVYYRKGWLDEALKEYEMACAMDPNNAEYRQAYQYMRAGGSAYRPEEYGSGSMMDCKWCQNMICAGLACSACSGGRVCLCC